jgi:hypothetical protein
MNISTLSTHAGFLNEIDNPYLQNLREEAKIRKQHPLYPEYRTYLQKNNVTHIKSCSIPRMGYLIYSPQEQKECTKSFHEFLEEKKFQINVKYTIALAIAIMSLAFGFLSIFYFKFNLGLL